MTRKFKFPAGDYYIGDPCYAIPNEVWDKVIDITGCFGLETENELLDWNDGLYHYEFVPCWAHGTRWGDGVYGDNNRREYAVDAGLIGIIPSHVVAENKMECARDGGNFVSFKKDFNVWYEDGAFHFGNIKINTDD